MRSAPTTSLDLGSAELVADPYPSFAAERAAHPVAWHEPSGMFLTFAHAAAERGPARPAPGPDLAGPGRRPTTSSRSTCCTATR